MSWTLRVAPSANNEFKSLPEFIHDEAANLLVDLLSLAKQTDIFWWFRMFFYVWEQ